MYNHFIIVVFLDSQRSLRSIEKYFLIFDSIVYRTSTTLHETQEHPCQYTG